MSTRLRFAACGWLTELTWLTWFAGGLVLGALVHFQLAIAAYPTYFVELRTARTVHYSWTVGWPLPFATCSLTHGWSGIALLSLLVDTIFAAALVVGTMAAVRRWTRGRTYSLPANGQTLAVIVVTLLGWIVLLQTLSIPWFVFLGWAALVVIFLVVPCAAYSLVIFAPQLRHSTRFSIRTLLVAVTVFCIAAAAVAWRMNAIRAERLARVPRVRVESMDYGLMETVDTRDNGRLVARDYRIVKQTQAIPCTLGTIFGIEYVLSNDLPSANQDAPRQDHVQAYFVWRYPSEITDPKLRAKQRQAERQIPVRTGERHVEVFWLGSEPYLVPGQWQLEIWQSTGIPGERRKLLEQVFVVGEK
jgi:hypothetical protein